ncbi:chaperone protein DNAj [Trypanosoma brucei equiperdum]|uniref:Chaperone protein DNAj n=1 Tax=Trypanosoma brucei equiperdum TaxID=630700 RepID=A0A3L6L7E4_9TRYP|nr:chaperone protein DNAj [Trypanosoma brucei equiperdum]
MSSADPKTDVPHGFRLIPMLFYEYFAGSAFNVDVLKAIFRSIGTAGSNCGKGLGLFSRTVNIVIAQLSQRVVEWCVVAYFTSSNSLLLHRAAVLHCTFPYVQHYRFSNCWITHFPCSVAKIFVPSFLWNWVRNTIVGLPSLGDDGTDGVNDYGESISFYNSSYASSTPAAVVASSLVSEITEHIIQQIAWAVLFYRSRDEKDALWPMVKRYLSTTVESLTHSVLIVCARSVGAWFGGRVSRNPSSGCIFWCERTLLLLLGPAIGKSGRRLGVKLLQELERFHPTTEAEARADDARSNAESSAHDGEDDWNTGSFFYPTTLSTVDYYEVLGVERTASLEDIKRAYRAAALQNHPDHAPKEAEAQNAAQERMAVINQAYETLGTDSKRRKYDQACANIQIPGVFSRFNDFPLSTHDGSTVLVAVASLVVKSFVAYAQYYSSFLELTGLGKGPLRYVGFL